jgi:hypothetical protein
VRVRFERGVPELRHRSCFDLSYALTGQVEVGAHFVQGSGFTPVEAETKPKDGPFPIVEYDQQLGHLTGQEGRRSGIEWRYGRAVFDEITNFAVAVGPQWFRK